MVVRLCCLMASHGYLPGVVVSQGQASSRVRVIKDYLPFLPGPGVRPEVVGFGSLSRKCNGPDYSWRSLDGLLEYDKLLKIESSARPSFNDLHENQPDSLLVSHGISENFTRNEEIMRILTSSSETQRSELDLSLRSPEIGFHPPEWQPQSFSQCDLGISYYEEEPRQSLIIPNGVICTEKLILDLIGDLSHNTEVLIGSGGQISFTGSRSEMKDIQSIIAEHYFLHKTQLRRKQSVVPYYYRRASRATQSNASALSSMKSKSPEKVINKPSPKRSINKLLRERSPHENSYSHACEILLSLIMNRGRHEKTMLLSLKKPGFKLPELLTQFSVGIAGTGLAVLLTVVSKMVFGRLPISTSKVLSMGIGIGLLWLSRGVNRLRDTIKGIGRSSGKLGCKDKDESAMSKVDESMNETFFRTAVLMVMIVLRLS